MNERSLPHPFAGFSLDPAQGGHGQRHRQICLVGLITALLGDRDTSLKCVTCSKRVDLDAGDAVGEQRERQRIGIVCSFGSVDHAGSGR